jgi:integrase
MQRRSAGEGSIYQRSDGMWVGSLPLPDSSDGKRRRKVVYGKTRKAVSEKLKAASQSISGGELVTSTRLRLGAYLDVWLNDVILPHRERGTYEGYESKARLYIKPHLGNKALVALTPRDVQTWITTLSTSGLSARSVEYAHATLRACLNQAIIWGDLTRNVAMLARLPKQEGKEQQVLTLEQAKLFIEHCKQEKYGNLFIFAIGTGLRKSECLGVRWSDVEDGILTVRQQVQRRLGITYYSSPKTERGKRTILLPAFTREALLRQFEMQTRDKLIRSKYDDRDLIFAGDFGGPRDQRSVSRNLDEYLAACCVPRVRFHDLRHTFATLLLARGVDVRLAMDLLGHSQANVTQSTYQHVLREMRVKTSQLLENLLGDDERPSVPQEDS